MYVLKWLAAAVLAVPFFQPVTGAAMTPGELQSVLEQGQRITIIDVRNSNLYRTGHIPGAINVPAAVVSAKRLPPLGRVVVCGDGIRTDLSLEALAVLNTKNGINAEILEGGFGAWQDARLQTTEKAGLSTKSHHYMSYQALGKAAAANPDMVLVDLRRTGQKALTDLRQEFPLQSVIRLSRKKKGWDIGPCLGSSVRQKLLVLIDDGKEEGLEAAKQLTAAGIKRIALLAGGEVSLARKGAVGKKTVVTRKSRP